MWNRPPSTPHLRLDPALCLATAIPIGYRAATPALVLSREICFCRRDVGWEIAKCLNYLMK
jgi:hypothetical protein